MADEMVLDFDAEWEKEVAAKGAGAGEVVYRKVKLLGNHWRVADQPSATATLEFMENDGAQLTFILGYIHPEERAAFKRALESDPNMTIEKIATLADLLSRDRTGFPTVQPATSPPTPAPDGTSGTAPSSGTAEAQQAPQPAPTEPTPAAFEG